MPLQPGTTLGPYAVTAKIGEGGMGEVYRARDTKLDRDVALKVLPEAFTSDPDRLARFEREAKVLASLNHPNIGHIYGLEEAEGTRALVLELIEGPTLADRIAQGPIPIDEALPIAKQIAEALEAAHEAGVIHRDLKPANIKVKEDGTVKVLDFGLAKALEPAPGGDASQSPTLTAAATQMGMVMGTAAYMSPEQAAGQTADKRSDLWSFGVVLFEMLTGQRLFTGETVAHVMAKVLDRELDLAVLPTTTPAPLGRLLRRCLERNQKRRLSDAGEVLSHLEEAATSPPGDIGRPADWRQVLPWALGTLMIGSLVTGLGMWSLRPAPSLGLPARFVVSAPPSPVPVPSTLFTELAISADGRRVVYRTLLGGEDGLYVRPVDALQGELLPGTATAASVFLSPDGTEVGFYSRVDQALKKIRISDGIASTLWPGPLIEPRGASWGGDGTIIFAHTDRGVRRLSRISAAGGEPDVLTTPDELGGHYWPELIPGGRAVLFTVVRPGSAITGETSQIALLELETGDERVLLPRGTHPRYVSSGHLIYSIGDTLWAVVFDADRLEVIGDPIAVLEGTATNGSGGANIDVSDDGLLVYQLGEAPTNRSTLVWVDRQGREEAVAAEPRPYAGVRLSPNGRLVMTQIGQIGVSESVDLQLYDLTRNTNTPFTFHQGDDAAPLWSPDGQQVVFHSFRDGTNQILSKAADSTGQLQALKTSDNILLPLSFSPDGRTLVFQEGRIETGYDIGVLSLDGDGTTEWLLAGNRSESGATVSPDGRWIAYLSDESGQPDLFVRPFPNVDDRRWSIARNARNLVWGPDSSELFYQRREDGAIAAVPIVTEPTFSPGSSSVLFSGPYVSRERTRTFDTKDGERFLLIKEPAGVEASAAHIVAFQHFDEELTRLVPTP